MIIIHGTSLLIRIESREKTKFEFWAVFGLCPLKYWVNYTRIRSKPVSYFKPLSVKIIYVVFIALQHTDARY